MLAYLGLLKARSPRSILKQYFRNPGKAFARNSSALTGGMLTSTAKKCCNIRSRSRFMPTLMASKTSAHGQPRWKNPVKEQLRKGKPVMGATISVNSVEVAAQVANMGFDFLWLEMEHAPLSLETVRNVVLATRGLPAVPFARPPVNELWTAKRLLDAGVLGVVFPFTSTPDLARQAAAACRYPPDGLRGSGAAQSVRSEEHTSELQSRFGISYAV